MKRIARLSIPLLLLTLCVPALLVAEGGREKENTVIGISKFVTHPALDALEKGIRDELAAQGRADIEYDLQVANGDVATAKQIATKFKADRVDLAIGIATPSAQALKSTLSGIPVVYTAITDPLAAGLVGSTSVGEAGIAGVSHRTPVKMQIEFLNRLKPIRALGHIYTGSEANAVVLAKLTEAACRELGIEFVGQSITGSAEVKQAAQSIASRVDAFYVSTDNTVVSALQALADVAMKAGVPILSADPSSAETNPVFAAWGFNWYQVGRLTGRIVDRILDGEDPAGIPTTFVEDAGDLEMILNLDVAAKLGIRIPDDMVARADRIIRDGVLIEQ